VSPSIIYRLQLPQDLSLDALKKKVEQGSRFIVLPYCISVLFAITLRRFSPAILIHHDEELEVYQRKYKLITWLLGWWGFPWGPVYSLRYLKVIKSGGIDVTEEVILNIDEASLQKGEVVLKITNQLFCKPYKWDTKSFRIAFEKHLAQDRNIKKLVVALLINNDDEERPPYIIGLAAQYNYQGAMEMVLNAFYTEFRKHTSFKFIDLSAINKTFTLLEKQGEVIVSRD
jgi:hypothetical protein